VITESEYEDAGGSDSAVGEGTVAWSRLRTVTLDVRGLRGVTGSECCRYHANTAIASDWIEDKDASISTFVAVFVQVGGCSRYGEPR
jgi:hypothetical protein